MSENSCNSLCRAIKKKSIDLVQQALLNKEDHINHHYPLHLAIQYRCPAVIVRLLIEAGAYIHLKDSDGNTPLHIACKVRNEELGRLLLSAGSRFDVQNHKGITPVQLCARECGVGMLEFLLEMGANINCRTSDNKTLLHFAAMGQNDSVLRYLISRGLDLNARDDLGRAPFRYCIRDDNVL